jgi:lipopolysaccharide transport system ATP-binding protein
MSDSAVAENPVTVQEKETLLTLDHVSKSYRLWHRPYERFIYGLWNQLPSHSPKVLQEIAARQKAKLGQEVFALQEVSLSIRKGRSVGVIGQNGSGKSTLLQLIAGVLQSTTGQIKVNTERVTALLELGSGFDPNFTGRENVLLHGALSGLSESENKARLDEVLEFSEIGEYIDRPVKTYSSGMAVRLAFASSITVRPELLIVDEALAVGDIFFQQRCFQKIRDLVDEGVTILLVSHDTRSISEFCEETLLLDHGRVVFFGDSNQAISRYYGLTRAVRSKAGRVSFVMKNRPGATTSPQAETEMRLSPVTKMHPDEDAMARFSGYVVLDQEGNTTALFQQGDWLAILFEVEVRADLENLSSGITLRDQRGALLLCKHQFQIDHLSLRDVRAGENFRATISLCLNLTPGNYTLDLDLISIPHNAFQDGRLSFADFDQFSERICSTHELFAFAVGFNTRREGSEFSHFGVVDLPSRVSIQDKAE